MALVFTARDAMLALALAMALCLSVCHKSVFYRNEWTESSNFWHGGFFRPVLHCVLRKFRYLQKCGYFPLEIFLFLLTPSIIAPQHIYRGMCYQLSLRKVDAQSVINWAVVCQLS